LRANLNPKVFGIAAGFAEIAVTSEAAMAMKLHKSP
jgi:hypothetical protein